MDNHLPIIKTCIFQFFDELKDFLPAQHRTPKLEYSFTQKPSIKDAIQAIGVPHVDVDVILVQGKSVDFDFLLSGGEDIEVYPKSSGISGKHLGPDYPEFPKFIVDVNLGKLVPKLRLLGFDTLYKNDYNDHQIVEISNHENRVILTRDIGILKYNAANFGYWVRNTKPYFQAEEVIRKFNLKSKIKPFTRCSVCNGILVLVEKESIAQSLPQQTREQYKEFTQCESCKKIYWKGSHVKKILFWIESL
ncbi:MAG: Mut7-C ubiquitin/RNAse domain-containing protein [Candidatus Marinimicrobia bacterium]|nr:Mut7-C ubiquitin/RNAse domain-containing protein [Candidatus Neomarinimicrobiota bacterium]